MSEWFESSDLDHAPNPTENDNVTLEDVLAAIAENATDIAQLQKDYADFFEENYQYPVRNCFYWEEDSFDSNCSDIREDPGIERLRGWWSLGHTERYGLITNRKAGNYKNRSIDYYGF